MAKVLNQYFMTIVLVVTLLVLSVGFNTAYHFHFSFIITLILCVTLFNFLIETSLQRLQLSMLKRYLIQSIIFPINIGLIALILGVYYLCV